MNARPENLTPVQRTFNIQQERCKQFASKAGDSRDYGNFTIQREKITPEQAYRAKAIHLGISLEELQGFVSMATLVAQQLLSHAHEHGNQISVDDIADNLGLTMLEFGHILANEQLADKAGETS